MWVWACEAAGGADVARDACAHSHARKDFGGDEDAAFEHLVSSLQAPAVQEPATLLERVVEAFWALLAMIAAALGVGQRAAGEAHPHSD